MWISHAHLHLILEKGAYMDSMYSQGKEGWLLVLLGDVPFYASNV